jgi:hypothetical protein
MSAFEFSQTVNRVGLRSTVHLGMMGGTEEDEVVWLIPLRL